MRIALFLERPPGAVGGFQQALSMVLALAGSSPGRHEIVVFAQHDAAARILSEHGLRSIRFGHHRAVRLLDRWSGTAFGHAVLRRLRRLGFRRLGRHLDALLADHRIDLVVLTECTEVAARIGDHPFIVTVWDVLHRDHPEFPEIYRDRTFEQWERARQAALPRAFKVIVDSPFAARRIGSLYGVDPHRIIALPYLPSVAVRRHAAGQGRMTADEMRRKYGLAEPYVFYPAHFGALKNHLYLLEGLAELARRHGVALHAALSGEPGDGGDRLVARQAEALGLAARVHFLGTVPDDDIPALYEGALALVMPAYSGPTNLAPLEAVALGCPVVYADLPAFREQMGEAALYCDLNDPASLADRLAALAGDPDVAARRRAAAQNLAAEIAAIDYAARLEPVFDEFAYLRRRWAWPDPPAPGGGLI